MASKPMKLYPARFYFVVVAGREEEPEHTAIPLLRHEAAGRVLPAFTTERKAERFSGRVLEDPETYLGMVEGGGDVAAALSRGFTVLCLTGEQVAGAARDTGMDAVAIDPEGGVKLEPVPIDEAL